MLKKAAIFLSFLPVCACSGGQEAFFIVQNQVPDQSCVITTERTVYRGEGTLDVALVGEQSPFAYQLHPLLQNDLAALGEPDVPEPNRLALREFRVSVELADEVPAVRALFNDLASSHPELLRFRELFSGQVDPGGGLAAASTTVIPGELARRIAGTGVLDTITHLTLLVRVRAIGERSQGLVESDEFRYPIRVCRGCLISDLRACPYTPIHRGNACNLAQDELVDCCTDGSALFCPARAER